LTNRGIKITQDIKNQIQEIEDIILNRWFQLLRSNSGYIKLPANKNLEVANLGKTYNSFGTVIQKSPVTQINGINDVHAIDRAIERGVKPQSILNTLRNPEVILSQWNGQRFAFITSKTTVIIDNNGNLVTVWSENEYTDLLFKVLKEAKR